MRARVRGRAAAAHLPGRPEVAADTARWAGTAAHLAREARTALGCSHGMGAAENVEAGQRSTAPVHQRSGGARPGQRGKCAPSRVQRRGSPEALEAQRPSLVDKLMSRCRYYLRKRRAHNEGSSSYFGTSPDANRARLMASSRQEGVRGSGRVGSGDLSHLLKRRKGEVNFDLCAGNRLLVQPNLKGDRQRPVGRW